MAFELGSAVEVSIDCKHSSWFSGTIISCMDSERFLVQYHNMAERAVVSLHQLRPLPPLESQHEFKSGDKVEAFHMHQWWEGHVTKDLGKGRFVVSLRDSVEIPFPKELIRTHQEWINHNWVPSCRDRISELPDNVLLHILNFMDTRHAIQTCVLSKRWKYLCKRLNNLIFTPNFKFGGRGIVEDFEKFASWVVSSRDDSYSLLSLTIRGWAEPNLLDRVIKYALLHNVQELTMYITTGFGSYFKPLPSIFCCQSLTSLKLWVGWGHPEVKLPKSLHLPALKGLLLCRVTCIASDNDYAEPFSNCHVLDNLVLMDCYNDAQVLSITNSSLSSLTLVLHGEAYQIKLTTPCLSSITIKGTVSHQILSTYNLSFLEEVYIDVYGDKECVQFKNISIIIGWLQVLSNVKILRFSTQAIRVILRDLSLISFSTRPQPPSFVRLELFKVKMNFSSENISDEEVNEVTKYLLQNSPSTRVDIIRPSYIPT